MNWKMWLPFLLLPLFAGAAHAAESADATFARAEQLADIDLTQARELYRVAALQYQSAAQARPAQRGPLLYNAGNAFFFAGDQGRAVLAYRRAEQVMPGSSLLQDNLEFVRRQCGNAPETVPPDRWAALRFWRWNPAVQWTLFAASWLLLWAALLYRQWRGGGLPGLFQAGMLALAALMAGTLAVEHLRDARRCRGVIVTPQVEARKGPNYGYAPAFTAALDAGLECEVLGGQGGWLHLRLAPDRECWVRRSTVELWQGRLQEEIE